MVKMYADYEFYNNEYLMGRKAVISIDDFPFYSVQATIRIRQRTSGNINETLEIPDEVKMCCCDVAEHICKNDMAADETGRTLQSYSNDGQSGTYADSTKSDRDKDINSAITRYLSGTGLLFCGVRR